MVSYWRFLFLKSYYYLNFSSWGLLLNRSWVPVYQTMRRTSISWFNRKTLSIWTICRPRKKMFFRDFYFYDFRFKRNEVHGMEIVNNKCFSFVFFCFFFFCCWDETAHSLFCLCFYSLSRYSQLDGFSLTVFCFWKAIIT